MSVEATERVVRTYLDALLSGGDFAQYLSDDVVWTTMDNGDRFTGRAAVRDLMTAINRTMFDVQPAIRGLAAADGVAYLEADFIGRHVGDFAGIAATGRQVSVPCCIAYEVKDDRIAAVRAYVSVAALTSQLTAT